MILLRLSFIRSLVVALPILLFTSCAPSAVPLSGSLSGSQHWQGVVRIAGDLVLEADTDLRIAPGTEILFLPPPPGTDRWSEHPHFPGSELIVHGRIVAEGRPGQPIVFRSADTNPAAGSWGGVNLDGSPDARFRYCRFHHADSALHSQESRVLVEESLFEGNLVAIRFHSSDIRIRNNTLQGNGTAIRFHFGAPVILLNDIRDNDKGFFITSHPRDYRIARNNIVGSRLYSVVLGEEVPQDVRLEGNFWGTGKPSDIEEGFFDGGREPHLGRVEYRPFKATPVEEAGISWSP